jgi:hypothetical protein
MRTVTRVIAAGLLTGAVLAVAPAAAFAEGAPPTKNVVRTSDEGDPPGPFAPDKLPGRPKAGEVTVAGPTPIPA